MDPGQRSREMRPGICKQLLRKTVVGAIHSVHRGIAGHVGKCDALLLLLL